MQSAGVDVEVCHVAEAARDQSQGKRRRLNNGGWGKSKQHDYGNESDLQEHDEEDDTDGAEDRDQWRFEEGEEAKGKWKSEGRLYTKAQLAEAEDSEGDGSRQDNKENFRLAKEGSRSLAATQTKRRPIGRRPPTSTLRQTTSLELRGDAVPVIIEL
jgi:hypothetical protein